MEELLKHREGEWVDRSDPNAVHEAGLLNLDVRKAKRILGWQPRWGFETTIEKTACWYVAVRNGDNVQATTLKQIKEYENER